MPMDALSTTLFTPVAGAWVGLVLALALFSAILGDQALARFAQHILVGGSLGYAALMAVREVLEPRLMLGLRNAAGDGWLWAPLVLGLLLWVAGLDALRGQDAPPPAQRAPWRRLLRLLGMIPVALMVGVSVTVALLGVLQGTLLPQLGVALRTQANLAGSPGEWGTVLLTLLLTTATLLFLTGAEGVATGPAMVRMALAAWRWIGQRALWLAAGVLFARLAAARISLLTGWVEFLIHSLQETGLWRWIE